MRRRSKADTPTMTALAEAFEQAKVVKKGECPHCGVHIGRGIAFHIKRCKGK